MFGLTRPQVQLALTDSLVAAIAPIATFPAVANNGVTASSSSAGTAQSTAGTSRRPHFAAVAATEITLTYSNIYLAGSPGTQSTDTVGPSSYLISAAIEIDGVVYPVTFAGSATVTIAPGAEVTSDPLPGIALSPGQLFFTRTFINSTNWRSNLVNVRASSEGGWVDTVDRTLAGSAAIADSIHHMFVPTRIGGKAVNGASLVIEGDSIAFGSGELNSGDGMATGGLAGQAGGFVARAAFGRAGVTSTARGGDQLQWFLKQHGHFYRLPLTRGFTHWISEAGTNDIFSGSRTLAQVQADLLNYWQIRRNMNMKGAHCTILPRTTSTDSWATTANQTVLAQESVRVALNTWLRAGAPITPGVTPIVAAASTGTVAGQPGHPLSAIFDTAAVVESSLNSGKFRVDQGTPTIDGVHPSTALHTLMAGVIPGSFFN